MAATQPRRTKAAQREQTTRRLVAIAREEFAQRGYALVSTEEIVRRAGVTRGALYHHFGSKEGLFAAVLDDVQRDIAERVAAAAAAEGDPWEQVRAGSQAFLTAALEPQVQQIALIDAPAVVGWDTWRRADAEHSFRLLRSALDGLAASGRLTVDSPEAAAHLLSGAMNEAALWVARSAPIAPALAAARETLDRLLDGLSQDSAAPAGFNPPAAPPRPD